MFLTELFYEAPILGTAASFLGVINPSALAFLGEGRPLLDGFQGDIQLRFVNSVVLVEVETLDGREVVPKEFFDPIFL